jgi:hypothetical protein
LPIDRLGILVLKHLADTNEWNSHNFLRSGMNLPDQTLRCWSEALNWLVSKNLVARGKPGDSRLETMFITRLGIKVLKNGLQQIQAAERLDVSLHKRLGRVKSQFLLGEYELAAFAAMREVEIRVRELSGSESSLLGVKLMRKCFGEIGPLADPDLDPAFLTEIGEDRT